MADYNSSLPVRTQDAGDVIVKIADASIPSQQAAVSAAGEISVLSTAQPGVDLGDVTVNNGSGAAAVNIQDGGNSITVDATDLDIRDLSSATDSVTVVATDLDIRDLSSATDSVEVLQATHDNLNANANIQVGDADVSNSNPVPISDAGGSITVDGTVTANQGGAPWSQNITQVNGSTISASNPLPSRLSDGSAFYSDSNPVPVKFSQEGTPVNDYKAASSIAAGASDNHDYTAVGTFILNQVESTASGKAKMVIAVESGVGTGTFNTRFVAFNSTAETNMSFILSNPISVAAGVRVRVTMSNRDLLAQDLYSTICGLET